MGGLALVASFSLDRSLVDPEGFLGPSWLRLPLLVFGAFLLDILPRTLWVSRMRPKLMPMVFSVTIQSRPMSLLYIFLHLPCRPMNFSRVIDPL